MLWESLEVSTNSMRACQERSCHVSRPRLPLAVPAVWQPGGFQSFGRRHVQRIRRVRSVFSFRRLCLFFCTRLSALHCEDVPRLQVIKIYALVPSLSLLPGHTLQLVFLA